jgi:hypothetical protein
MLVGVRLPPKRCSTGSRSDHGHPTRAGTRCRRGGTGRQYAARRQSPLRRSLACSAFLSLGRSCGPRRTVLPGFVRDEQGERRGAPHPGIGNVAGAHFGPNRSPASCLPAQRLSGDAASRGTRPPVIVRPADPDLPRAGPLHLGRAHDPRPPGSSSRSATAAASTASRCPGNRCIGRSAPSGRTPPSPGIRPGRRRGDREESPAAPATPRPLIERPDPCRFSRPAACRAAAAR